MTAYGATPIHLNTATCKEAASYYLSVGLRPIPWEVRNNRKVVCLRGFSYNDYLAAPISRIQRILDRWQDEWQVGLALAEAGTLFAVDVDDWEQLDEFEKNYGEIPRDENTWWNSTGRKEGGAHALFQRGKLMPEWPKHAAFSRAYPNLEIKSNGFIAAPPSVHPTGTRYQWTGDSSGVTGCPHLLAAYLNNRQAQRSWAFAAGKTEEGLSTSTGITPADLLAEGIPIGIPQDNALRDFVWDLVSQGLPDAFIRSSWQVVVDKTPLTKPDEPWTEKDFDRHLRGAREKLGSGFSSAELSWVMRTGVSPRVEIESPSIQEGEEVILEAGASKNFSGITEGELSDKLMRQRSDGGIDLNATYRHLPYSDLGSAELLTHIYDGIYHFNTESRQWRYWNDVIHELAKDDNIGNIIVLYAKAYRTTLQRIKAIMISEAIAAGEDEAVAMESYEARWKEHRMYRDRMWNNPRQGQLNKMMQTLCSVSESNFDKETDTAACDNGVLILGPAGVVLESHSSDRLLTRRLGYNISWDASAEAPVFDKFIRSSVPDDDQRTWLQAILGMALFGHPPKGIVNFIGVSNTGKSTLSRILQQVFGTYAISVSVDTFLENGKGNNEFRIHELKGVRLAFAAEPGPGRKIDSEVVKALTGQDLHRTRMPYGTYVEWKPQALIVISSNQPMRLDTADVPMMERLRPVAFQRAKRLDHDLEKKLRGELPGILRWLVAGAENVVSGGHKALEPTASMVNLREEMAEQVDDVLRFVRESIDEGWLEHTSLELPFNRYIAVSDLYGRYVMWSAAEGIPRAVTKKTFSARVSRLYEIVRSNGLKFKGLSLEDV